MDEGIGDNQDEDCLTYSDDEDEDLSLTMEDLLNLDAEEGLLGLDEMEEEEELSNLDEQETIPPLNDRMDEMSNHSDEREDVNAPHDFFDYEHCKGNH